MNKAISTNSLPPAEERKPREAAILTTNKIQPVRLPDVSNDKRRRFAGPVITSRNIEQIQAENAKAAKKGGKKD